MTNAIIIYIFFMSYRCINSAYASISSVILSFYSQWILSIDNVLEDSRKVFEDVHADFCDIRKILLKFQEWKEKFPDSYCDAYISFCLPKLLNPLIRVQLINWNPLEVGASAEFVFFKNCMCVCALCINTKNEMCFLYITQCIRNE